MPKDLNNAVDLGGTDDSALPSGDAGLCDAFVPGMEEGLSVTS